MTPRLRSGAPAPPIASGTDRVTPLHRQVYAGIRRSILDGTLAPGARLASARVLADELAVSRNTVLTALAQLRAEGYVSTQERAGTFVASTLPETTLAALRRPTSPNRQTRPTPARVGLSARGQSLAALGAAGSADQLDAHGDAASAAGAGDAGAEVRAFRTGVPALDEFPWRLWARLTARRLRGSMKTLGGYGAAAGFGPLRGAIAAHVATTRGTSCAPEQVIVTGGAQQALELVVRLLLDSGDRVWMEDPGYPRARSVFLAAGACVEPVPVDDEGLDVRAGVRAAPDARLVYVTPSHQYPTGAIMTASRRFELLRWAASSNAWIVEDDYDSAYRYASRPLAALHGLDHAGRVLYVGTFSKTLFPALRLGYLVVPPPLAEAFAAARALTDRHPPGVEQAVLADFLIEGHFARHVRRMRMLYHERRDVLLEAAPALLGDRLTLSSGDAGMHLVGQLPPGVDDQDISARALSRGVVAPALSRYAVRRPERGALLLGYSAFPPRVLRAALRRLAETLER
ncbi:MAG: PLP-dependent aminotransferase family protein [Gemmatimonadaceae bacterium]